MKFTLKHLFVLVAIAALFALTAAGCGGSTSSASSGQALYQKANDLYKASQYTKAEKLYWKALPMLAKEGHAAEAHDCRTRAENGQAYMATYTLTRSDLAKKLNEAFPNVPQSEKDAWIRSGKLEHMTIDGKTMYYEDVATNIAYRNVELFRANTQMLSRYNDLVNVVTGTVIPGATAVPNQPYINPATFGETATITVPRDQLPKTGTLKIWLPVPIQNGPQTAVTVISVEPASYLKYPPSTDGDIGDAYLEVPLDQLSGDLGITLKYRFTRAEERFVVDPAKVGAYDKSDAVYIEYTRSHGNTAITSPIKKQAQAIVKGEKNPYLAAKKIYYWMLKNVKYSHMPHATLWPRGIPESVYVHTRRYGDCGAQSMYFSAMARSLGIPARATGGYQTLLGNYGDHFWAEFYLPNYGWVPLDTSIGQAPELATVTPEQARAFEDYYFGNMDNLRCVVQKTTDAILVPPAADRVLLPLALQSPAGNCDTMQVLPESVLWGGWAMGPPSQ